MVYTWHSLSGRLCDNKEKTKNQNASLIILNQPLDASLFSFWNNTSFRVCADGGANRLYNYLDDSKRSSFLPDCIIGDLDSIEDHVKIYYECKNVLIKKAYNQDEHDLAKSLLYIIEHRKIEHRKTEQDHTIFIMGGLNGRFDHSIAAINTLYRFQPKYPHIQFLLLSSESIVFLLLEGTHCIKINTLFEGPTCGLLPIGMESNISSSGLKWNLDKHLLSFGGLVSTSNVIESSDVNVQVHKNPIIWTTEIKVT